MKKIFSLLVVVIFSTTSYSQCVSGNTNIPLGSTVTFSSITAAQCASCYDWDINNNITSSDNSIVGNLQIIGSDMNQTVSIKGLALGAGSIQLTYFDETGCHQCTLAVYVVQVGANCCSPDVEGSFECRGSGGGHEGGTVELVNPLGCTVDWTKVSQVTATLSGAVFSGTTLTTKTLTGPFTIAPGFSVYGSASTCGYNHSFTVTITITYNNSCPSVTKSGRFYNTGTPPRLSNPIIVSPNPTHSIIKFEGANLSPYTISLFNSNGIEILKNAKIDHDISLENMAKGIYIYILTDENGNKQEGKIIKE